MLLFLYVEDDGQRQLIEIPIVDKCLVVSPWHDQVCIRSLECMSRLNLKFVHTLSCGLCGVKIMFERYLTSSLEGC